MKEKNTGAKCTHCWLEGDVLELKSLKKTIRICHSCFHFRNRGANLIKGHGYVLQPQEARKDIYRAIKNYTFQFIDWIDLKYEYLGDQKYIDLSDREVISSSALFDLFIEESYNKMNK